jgi:hypothetical protein
MRRLATALSLALICGCGSDAVVDPTLGPTDANVVGTFLLTASNGRSLPLVARLTSDEEWDLTSDQFVIVADNTWNELTSYRVTTFATGAVSTQQSVSSGTYSIANNQINFVMTVGGSTSFTGSVTGKTLALLYNGGQFLYSR